MSVARTICDRAAHSLLQTSGGTLASQWTQSLHGAPGSYLLYTEIASLVSCFLLHGGGLYCTVDLTVHEKMCFY